jgi:hypothetical protein
LVVDPCIEETEAITGLNTVLAVVDNVDSGTCDVTLDSKENAVKLLHGIEINGTYLSLIVMHYSIILGC